MASIAIAPGTGAVTLTPRWSIGGNLAGFHHMAQDLSLGGGANQFYSIKGTAIPPGGDIAAFTRYIAASGAATNHADIGSKLTPNSYSALTSADPDIGYGAVNFYFIHHKDGGDYFTVIKPSSGTASEVTDLKPMSGPGGPATLGDSGYFGLTFAAANLGYGLNYFYYLRTDPVTGFTKFGTLDPALLGTAADKFDLGMGGHAALAFTGTDVGFGTDKMYYLRLDPITGFTIFGTLHPGTGRPSDVANLGSVFSTLTFAPGDVGFGSGQFYTAGAINPTWQSVSFAAIADRAIGAGSFTVTPSASSALPITLTVVPGSTGAASISSPVGGVFTVTPTAPGIITLQATQAGQLAPTPYEFNMLRQSFTASGSALLAVTQQPVPATTALGATATFSVTATGTTAVSYQWRKDGVNIVGNASATTATLILPNVQATDYATYDVVVTNASGSIVSNPVGLSAPAPVPDPVAPSITSATTASGNLGTPFTYTIVATSAPTNYGATGLPPGLTVDGNTGIISGIPTQAGVFTAMLRATNIVGSDLETLTLTIAPAPTVPAITSAVTASGTVGAAFVYNITASGSPTSFMAVDLPAGLGVNFSSGAITGTPSDVGVFTVGLQAINALGTGTETLTLTVAPAPVAPTITSAATASGTVGAAFQYQIAAGGLPTSFGATGLPVGLTVNATTGAIGGTPTTAGVSTVTLSATNAVGTGTAPLTITVGPAPVPPAITNSLAVTGTVGAPFTFMVTASGGPTTFSASPLPAGLSIAAATGVITGTPTTVGTTSVLLGASNAAGTGNATLTFTVVAAGVVPIITNSPLTAASTVGTAFNFPITASGLPTSYTASPLPAGLSLNATTGVVSGTPTVAGTFLVTIGAANSTGAATAVVTLVVAPQPSSRIVNFSARGLSGPGSESLIVGFIVAGNGKNLLVRGIGPTLASFGVVNFMADPMLTLSNAVGVIASNDDWQTTATTLVDGPLLAATAARVGAFPLPNGSKDSALLAIFNDGAHSTTLLRPNGATGVALTEIYDTDLAATSRLVNVSARMNITAGEGSLIAGFIIAGNAPKTVLIRGAGPSLTAYGVAGALADPQIMLFSGSTQIASNDNWEAGTSTAAQITSTSARVGAFALGAGSKDAALMITLQPGNYSVQVTGVGTATGVALIEIYDTQ